MKNKKLLALVLLGLTVAVSACQIPAEEGTTNGTGTEEHAVAPTTDTKAADLRVVLNALEREHVALAAAATRAGFDGREDFEAVAGQLDMNSKELAKAVGSIYGAAAETEFYNIWKSHIGFFVDYTVAAKKGDKEAMDKAVLNLTGYAEAIAAFLSKANPNLSYEGVKGLVMEHVTLLKGAVDAHGAKDYVTSYKQQHAAHDQIGRIADALAAAIVKQSPEKF